MTFVSVEKLEDNEKDASFSIFSPESKKKNKVSARKRKKDESFESANMEEDANDDDISEGSSDASLSI